MIGIYKITNIHTGNCYIGQSTDIEQRFKEHIYHTISFIDFVIHEEGIENFKFEVLEECNPEDLDELEEYYISEYMSTIFGYNESSGGKHCRGSANANAKLTEAMVYNIRESYNMHERKSEVYIPYSNIVTPKYFSSVWEGRVWTNVHMDVYTPENLEYYRRQATNGELSDNAKFTNQEVLELRIRYTKESARSIYESVKDRCTFQTLQSILWGRSYKDVPIYSKKNMRWNN